MSAPGGGFGTARVSNLRAAEMAEYLDDRLHMVNYDEITFARSLMRALGIQLRVVVA